MTSIVLNNLRSNLKYDVSEEKACSTNKILEAVLEDKTKPHSVLAEHPPLLVE
jgi:hypothetical protein